MGTVTKKKLQLKPLATAKIKIKAKPSANLSLPTERSEPATKIGNYSLLLYGRKKIGKTSLVSNFPTTFCMMFEPGGKSLRIYQKPINQWEEFLGYIDLLETTDHPFKTVSIDTGRVAYERCMDYVCKVNGFEHPQDESYGKGWNKVRTELTGAFIRLMNLGLGVIVICHENISDITRRNSEVYNRITPDLPKQAAGFFAAVIDTIGYYRYLDDDKRVITIGGSEDLEAGTRCEENFFTKSGERIINIPMGNSSKEAYANLLNAFNNKQEGTGKEVLRKAKVTLKSLK